jgi:translation elongation factor aEF-1 beta
MGKVIAIYRMMMESPEQDTQPVEEKLKGIVSSLGEVRLAETKTEEVAFGLKALICTFVVPDKGNWLDQLESKFPSIQGVGSVEPLSVSLL